ncbi:MAG: hypothetical protein RIR41_2376, partial [Pseudomonadota bacterium]
MACTLRVMVPETMISVRDRNVPGRNAPGRDVDVCVCTFRRPSVARLLASLASQDLPAA